MATSKTAKTVYLEDRLEKPLETLIKMRRQSFTALVNSLIEKEAVATGIIKAVRP
jgi:hypothetical protein